MMDKLKKKIEKLLPKSAWIPYLTVFAYNFLVFYGTRLYNRGFRHYDLSIAVDEVIPFWPPAIVIYVLAYVQWVVCFALAMGESRELCRRTLYSVLIGETVCLLFFTFLPTFMERPDIEGQGIFAWMTKFIFSADTPDNLFPSIHCMLSWICFRTSQKCKKRGKFYKTTVFVFTIMVAASTLLVKQHLAADAAAGIVTAEAAFLTSGIIEKRGNNFEKNSRKV